MIPNLKALDGKGSFSCFTFGEQLVQDLESTASTDSSSGGGDGTKAPRKKCAFLAAVDWAWAPPRYVGVDLPQMALNRQLDNVFGGDDDEIRSALRTLLGRRFQHNNSKSCTVSTTCTRRIKWRIVHIKYRKEFDLSLQTCPILVPWIIL
jgi:hypothetical protein